MSADSVCSGLNLHSANLPVNLIPKKKAPKIPQIAIDLDYSRIPGHTYYSQKDASIIYLSLPGARAMRHGTVGKMAQRGAVPPKCK